MLDGNPKFCPVLWLLGSFGLTRLRKSQDNSDVWNIFLGYANNDAFGTSYNVLRDYPTVSAPEYAVPDSQVDPNIGEYSTPLLLPAKISLDTWVPMWALLTHEGNNIGRTFEGNRSWSNVNPDPNRWYIVYMRFLSQPVSSVTEKIIFPKYKIKNLKDYSVNINQLDIQK